MDDQASSQALGLSVSCGGDGSQLCCFNGSVTLASGRINNENQTSLPSLQCQGHYSTACGKVDLPQQQSGQVFDQDGEYFMLAICCFHNQKQKQTFGAVLPNFCITALHSKVCMQSVRCLIDPTLSVLQLAFGPWVLLSLAAAVQMAVSIDANGRHRKVSFFEWRHILH